MPAVVERAQAIYVRRRPILGEKFARAFGARWPTGAARRRDRIGDRESLADRLEKMERAGLRPYFRFGAFAELAKDRAGLVRFAIRHARHEGWIGRESSISLIGDHPNDVRAAERTGFAPWPSPPGSPPRRAAIPFAGFVLPDLRSLTLEMLL